MKVETRELPDGEVEFSFEVEDARVERAMDVAFRHLAGHVNIAGFRRGKAPRSLVERALGREALLEEALNHLLPEVFEEALRESHVRALTEPQFDVEGFNPLKAKATIVVPPAVVLGDYRSIEREPTLVTVTPEEVDAFLEQMRESHAEWVPVERAAEMGDRVAIDVKGVAETRTIVEQEDVEYLLRAESPSPVPGFAEQLAGVAAGESRSFTLTIPATDDDHELAGKDVVFEVTAKDVKAKELPEVDDYFASTLGEFSGLDELKQQVEEQLREQAEVAGRREHEAGVIEEAVKGATLVIPDKLITQQAQRARDRLARELDSSRISIEQYLRITQTPGEEFDSQLRVEAERNLRRGFVLQAIAAEEALEIADDEIDNSIRTTLAADNAKDRDVSRALRQPEIRDRVRSALLEQHAAQWLVDRTLGSEPAMESEVDPALTPREEPGTGTEGEP